MKIGFFDSGIGGLSVLHRAFQMLPAAQYLYYADEEHVPYGEKTQEQIIAYTDRAVRFMTNQGAAAVVIACNTATSAAIHLLRGKYSIPIIGMEPAVKKALDSGGEKRVLAAATPVTVRGRKMRELVERVDKQHLVDLIALPGLVRFAEQGMFEPERITQYLTKAFAGFCLQEYSALVLGCTHFNYFKDSFRAVLPETVSFVDGNEGTVRRLQEALPPLPDKTPGPCDVSYYYSGRLVLGGEELERLNGYLRRLDHMLDIR